MKNRILASVKDAKDNYNKLLLDNLILDSIELIVKKSIEAFKDGKKMLLCGNGGSASDAQHIAAELSGRFMKDRKPLHAEALHVNTSYLTAVSNDYGFDKTYERMVDATGKEGDILIGISTSGNSCNVLNAVNKGRERGMFTIGFLGNDGGKMNNCFDVVIKVPHNNVSRIQEAHILIGHIICQLIEEEMF